MGTHLATAVSMQVNHGFINGIILFSVLLLTSFLKTASSLFNFLTTTEHRDELFIKFLYLYVLYPEDLVPERKQQSEFIFNCFFMCHLQFICIQKILKWHGKFTQCISSFHDPSSCLCYPEQHHQKIYPHYPSVSSSKSFM